MYVLYRKSLVSANIQRFSQRSFHAVEALGAADGPLRVAHHTGGKLMSTSQGAGWEPERGGRGFHEQKKVERRCRHWVDDVDDS